ncbi:TonB-dependent receptor [Erythrobacter sp. SDW2]|uniref:TonB-dependent receptor n=1 Tax=Erythrobacter sp. SDW2 TaxID=2907154 RepID=UPI001F253BD1|nr:TonB-dependent receptor [Erythrobacter sp. SDW2]UIP06165.1 TonB-dependent receptor [Erythrobacter sp. SDW2]
MSRFMSSRRTTDTNSISRRVLALGTASSIALCAMMAQPAFAQDAEEEPDAEEPAAEAENIITVTGFRASLESAQGIKRDADTFVDVITAEDIGALPDRSVAEALQRVPGVNIGRFEKTSDPDRFSVEGTGVIVRGLPFVRSELNGRDIFSANGGTVLSFNDVSPELLGRVEVFKNVTADMVEGGISGIVNLVTRKPLDTNGFKIAGTVGYNFGDMAEEWSPEFSVLASNVWENDAGRLGVQLGYANSELISRTDASQLTDPCYRAATLDGPCLRVLPVGSGGIGGTPNFDESNFPPPGTVISPKGAGVRTTELERDREAWSGTVQYEDPTGDFVVTFEWLRSETSFYTDEYAILAQVNDDALFPVPRAGSTWEFDDNGVFQRGILTQRPGDAYATPFGRGGIPMESLRFQRDTTSITQDFSFDLKWSVTDRLRLSFEAQRVESELSRDSIIGAMNTWADVSIDASGDTPLVEFLAPAGSPADYFSSGFYTYYWFLLDSLERNEGDLDTLRFDGEYDISDDGFFKKARFGVRWSDRERTNRNTNFSTWGNLSAPWAGRAGCAPWGSGPNCPFQPGRFYTGLPGQEFAIAGGAYTDDFPNYSQVRNPFGDGFQRGNAPTPIENGAAWFFGGDDFLGEYLSGESARQAREINTFSQTPNPFFGVQDRSFTQIDGTVVPCDPFCPPEVSTVGETTKAAYARVDFGKDLDNGWNIDGNFGLRYVQTKVRTAGLIGFPNGFFFDNGPAGNGDGIVQVVEIVGQCNQTPPGQTLPGYCSLSAARQQEFANAFTGEFLIDDRDITFDHWLPAFNVKLDIGNGLLFRAAVSKGISRPDLQLFTAGGAIGDNTNDLRAEGTLETGPLFQLFTGNRNVRPVESWNYDLSAEWYFDDVGSLTASFFLKDIKGIVSGGADVVEYTSPGGTTIPVEVNGPINSQGGTLKGVELAYQQTFDFLPGLLSGFGTQLTYTYVDGGDFINTQVGGAQRSPFASAQPLAGISDHTINATIFYEKGPFAARAAYNWRSDFLITPRDDIFPFSPIWQEASGQLDASIFYAVTDQIKLGVQGVNLLDSVTRTTQVVDFDGTRITRSAFRNDRRFTFLARFDF